MFRLLLTTGFVALIAIPGQTATTHDKPRVKVEFRIAEDMPDEGLTEVKVSGSDVKVYLRKEAILTNGDIASARVVPSKAGDNKSIAIELTLTKDGAEKAHTATEDQVGKRLAIVVDGKVILAPKLRAAVGEKVLIAGMFSAEVADGLVQTLNDK